MSSKVPLLLGWVALAFGHGAHAISVEVIVTHQAVCTYGGRISGTIFGGTPPFEVSLSTGQQLVSSSASFILEDIPAGSHQLTVTDAVLDAAFANVQINQQSSFTQGFAFPLPRCGGQQQRTIVKNFGGIYEIPGIGDLPGVPPLTINAPNIPVAQAEPSCWQNASYLVELVGAPGTTSPPVTYVDALGCPGSFYTNFTYLSSAPEAQFLDIVGSCSNRNTGRITVSTTGGALQECVLRMVVYRSDGSLFYPNCLSTSPLCSSLPCDRTFEGLPPGSYFLRLQLEHIIERAGNWNAVSWPSDCVSDFPFTISDLGPCAVASGTAAVDNNSNCTIQFSEPRVPDAVIEVLPGPFYGVTSAAGTYAIALPAGGAHTMTLQHPAVEEHCVNAPIPFTAFLGNTTTTNIATLPTVPLDVSVALSGGAARPGFQLTYGLLAKNLTPAQSGNTTMTLVIDPAVTYISASPAPTTVNGNTLTWSQSSLSAWSTRSYSVQVQVPPDVALIGTDLLTVASLTTANTDGNQVNNTAERVITVTGSYDPNDKRAVTSSGSTVHWTVGEDEWIDYTVRFQNTGTDTAFSVVIRDTLASNLDPLSLVMGAASHAYSWRLEGQGVLKVLFPHILLPHSSVNEPRSHGFVSFRIRPRLPVTSGETILNTAGIYFDLNPPILTPPSIILVHEPVALAAKVMLAGPYSLNLMNDALRTLPAFSLVEPYTALGFGNAAGGGSEATSAAILSASGNGAIVDWVHLELRSASDPTVLMATRNALVQRDGDIVSANDGSSPVRFNAPAGDYHVVIRHRNHQGVMTDSPITLSSSPTLIDFTNPGTPTYGINPQINVGGTMVLWPGDTNGDGVVKYVGNGNDRDPILTAIGGSTPTNTVSNVYSPLDVNLDGVIKYIGANNDRDVILTTVGGSTPNNVRVQQLP
ncbi:MAG: hypothetical protein IPM12_05770 [Flavobacteriales bacterium]|nr:hypothetical protein [Flavobacteriales bacterium]